MDGSAISTTAYERQVLDVVRALALEVGGPRALQAVTPTASFEREIGFGSLERVELILRLEAAFGHELGERLLILDTPQELAAAAADVGTYAHLRLPPLPAVATVGPAEALEIDTLSSVADALWKRADLDSARLHVSLESDTGEQQITFGALRDGAAAIAAGLVARDVRPGERVAIMLPTGIEFLASFMGIMAAGMVPVPLYPPPRLERLDDYLVRQSGILANSEARWLITVSEAQPIVTILRRRAPSLVGAVSPEKLTESQTESGHDFVRGHRDDIALIQYTSGSTGAPKGVRLTHANLLANIRAMGEGLAIRPTDAGVSWLPLYHDMGLIGTWLTSMVYGIPLSLMSPLSFLSRPERWLWAIHKRQATLSAAPNFAYELCVRKVRAEAIEGLDLSSWRCAINGAEPVSASTLDRFAQRFEQYGFRRSAMMPVYGLAECSVALTFPPLDREPVVDHVVRDEFEANRRAVPAEQHNPDTLSFVSVGQPLPKHEVMLIDNQGREVPERTIGHLMFRGPSAMTEYFNNPAVTSETVGDDGWLKTGDLAYLANGELYIAGREKDLIIKGGRNIVPQEVEEIVGDLKGVRKGCVAAFGSADSVAGTEKLVVVAESTAMQGDAAPELEREAIARVATAIGIPPDVVIIVKPGSVPKTSSGKIRRSDAKRLFESGEIRDEGMVSLKTRVALLTAHTANALKIAAKRSTRVLYSAYVLVAGSLTAVVIGLPLWLLVAILPGRGTSFVLARFSARIALRLVGCRIGVEGLENIPTSRPFVLVSNHTSYADSLSLIATLPLDFVFVAKQELKSWPLVGTILRKGGHPMVNRQDLHQSIDDTARITTMLRGGEAVLFFPEGTFARAAGVRPFKMGAFKAAADVGCPVVPIALRGTRRILPSGTHVPRPGTVTVRVGEALHPVSHTWESARELRDKAYETIARHSGESSLWCGTR